MEVRNVIEWLNTIAPFESAEGFDNVGLLMGDPSAQCSVVMFGMDITEAFVKEAAERQANLIVSHHPFIFHALKRIDYSGPQGRALCLLAEHKIAVAAVHTNWDKAVGGVGDSLASVLELADVESADDYVRVGTLPFTMSPDQLKNYLCQKLRSEVRSFAPTSAPIMRIAVAGGAYGEGYAVALANGAQAYVVGEIAHHEILDACERGLTIFDAGHYATEMPGVIALYHRFLSEARHADWPVKVHLYSKAPYAGAILA